MKSVKQAIKFLRDKKRNTSAAIIAAARDVPEALSILENLAVNQNLSSGMRDARAVAAKMLREWAGIDGGSALPTIAPEMLRNASSKVLTAALIRPGFLVSLKTSLRGGINYQKQTLANEQQGSASIVKWETVRTIADAEEHARAVIARGKARAAVTRVCCASTFGLLCPESEEAALAAAIESAQAIAAEHNATANCTRLEVFAITGKVADSDVQAARAIGSEVKDLLSAMESAMRAADPIAIRDAANKMRAVSDMLGEQAQGKVRAAIAEARSVARAIVSKAEEAGQVAAVALDASKLAAVRDARFAVLDMLGEERYIEPAPIAPPVARGLDFEPIDDMPQNAVDNARSIELE